ncbi:hypothetical protein WJX73_005553 [Symbiochloris irregularis]|uniref:Uncharacterized protein n=1 Tax=Symbiochloris irregularis TaxID=706552 RepID=A0AAW1NR89_9CHLO
MSKPLTRRKDSFRQQRRSKWLERQARLMKLRSEAQESELLAHKRKRSLHNHLRKVKGLQHDLEELHRKRDAHTSLSCWQPLAVRHHHLQLLTGSRTEATWAIRDAEQRLKDAQMVVAGLRKALQGSDRHVYTLRQRLHVMEGR